jgi:hypothetical protein
MKQTNLREEGPWCQATVPGQGGDFRGRFDVMGKILEFDARRLGRKGKPISERAMTKKVTKFRKQKSADNSERVETRKFDPATAAALLFGCF